MPCWHLPSKGAPRCHASGEIEHAERDLRFGVVRRHRDRLKQRPDHASRDLAVAWHTGRVRMPVNFNDVLWEGV